MNDMSMRITPSRAARCSASQYGNQFWRPHESCSTLGLVAGRRIPVGALPAADVAEVGAGGGQPVVNGGALRAARGLHRLRRVVALVDHAERLDGARAAVLGVGLVAVQAVDVDAGDVDVGAAVDDPVRQHAAEAAAGEDADRVEAGGDEVVLQLGRLADDRAQVGREALRAAEELLDAGLERDRARAPSPSRGTGPCGPSRAGSRRRRSPGGMPSTFHGAHTGSNRPDHQAAALLAEVAVGGRVLEHRQVRRQVGDPLGDQVVVLGRLQRDVDADLARRAGAPTCRRS